MIIRIKKTKILTFLILVTLVLTLVNMYNLSNLNKKVDLIAKGITGGNEQIGAIRNLLSGEIQPTIDESQQPQQLYSIEVSADDDPSIGSDNAPITIIEFSDYQCIFCAKARTIIEQILEDYGNNIRIVYRDFPILGPQSQIAAEASECADEQGKFWEYHNKLFENQLSLNIIRLKQYAADLGLNTSEFNECLDSGKMAPEVQKDSQDGLSYGIKGTPTFFINGILVSGAQPYRVFQQIIEQELNSLGVET